MKQNTHTAAQVRAAMRAEGINLKAWCREHNQNYWIVRDLLRGRIKGNYGVAHQAAVLLGIKPAVTSKIFTA